MKKIPGYLILILLVLGGCTNRDVVVNKKDLLGYDYRLFQGTPSWTLAKAVEDQDADEITNIISKNKNLLEAREPKFGQTLLKMAVKTLKFQSVKTLVSLGADPNNQDKYDGSSPLMEAARIDFLGEDYGSDPRYLKILLAHGGDPNAEEKGVRRKGNGTRYTPLLRACSINNLEYVKILVDAGANVNYNNELGMNPLGESVLPGRNPDITIYLIQKGADCTRPIYPAFDGMKPIYIAEGLRGWHFDLGSEEYRKKMKLVDLLTKKGIDYRHTPIPKGDEKNYPKEYLEKY